MLQRYIESSWQRLTRSHKDLVAAASDPKVASPDGRWVVYVPPAEDLSRVAGELRRTVGPGDLAKLLLRTLPATPVEPRGRDRSKDAARLGRGARDAGELDRHGLLYLPHPYVVPGGRFNEMYGWDSFFIVLGLLDAGLVDLARMMTDNHLYQVRHYGTVLNANRTYYLTRSQPPFLAEMVLRVYRRTGDRAWLARALPEIETYYRYWTREPHLVKETGLSRYFDTGAGPAPEVVAGERDAAGRSHYDRLLERFRTGAVEGYDSSLFYDRSADRLTDLFYVADRSMRESGFDPSDRFGTFNAGAIYFNPVCLNSLLHLMERRTGEICRILDDPDGARRWEARAALRRLLIDRWLWNDEAGLYLDYDFRQRTHRRYPFLTTFFPLWVGVASSRQAALVALRLALFETPGGLQTSTRVSGNQWDAPFGWAPLVQAAVEGLRAYGHVEAADRITVKFLSMLIADFLRTGALFEKYDVVRRCSQVAGSLKFGYTSNEIGFGWTNAAFSILYASLSPSRRHELLRLDGIDGASAAVRNPEHGGTMERPGGQEARR
ncbi:MAG: alpha,alpha-trehalase [Candidatus Riflebacteria bacterium]|nr:alpha,alpha-trehalase [Candidatus Riflebacteria bacterium]